MPSVASRKKPSRNDITSEAMKATMMCGVGPAGKKAAAEKEHQGKRPSRHHVIHQLVGHAPQQQKADQVDRLHQILLDLAVADLQGDAVASPGMLENARLICVSR